MPSLREMRGDISGIADRILAQLAEAGKTAGSCTLAPETTEWVEQQDWPGNYDKLARTLVRDGEIAQDRVLTGEILMSAAAGAAAMQLMVERLPVPASLPLEEPEKVETRPPFPLASDLAADSAKAAAPAAPLIPLRAAAPLRGLNAKSMFRPASQSYSFTQRLADALANADACVAR